MKKLADCVLFSVGERNYSLDDLIIVAKMWGDWDDIVREVRQRIACLKWVEDEGKDIDYREMEATADEFRYQRDLITSEETETIGTI